ncbi:MAG TPA: hypothetical protein VFC78_22595 [Tepidisphaeraceae bacterium]|nr:hypothetical protein [Tepidisphaeraceae bacterium]
MGMHQKSDRKNRGRSSISGHVGTANLQKGNMGPNAAKPNVPEELKTEANRPVNAGTKHRGDRRDMSKTYTGNVKHASRGNTARIDVKTRKR